MSTSRSPRPLLRITLAVAIATVSAPAFAIFQNGGFEQNNFTGWTLGGGTNPGLVGSPPFTGASVQITPGAAGPSAIVGALADPHAPGLVLPRVGQYTARVNDDNSNSLVTTLRQTDTVTAADIDAIDGLPHIRFAFAPVLQDPGHSPDEQPYFYVVVKNLADNSVLFEQFAYSGEPGANFLSGNGDWKYLPFQNVDAVLPASAIGQQVELTVVAADCSLGAHGGYVYIDGFGSAPVGGPGATAPAQPVPALGGLGLGLLGALCALAAGVAARRRRAV